MTGPLYALPQDVGRYDFLRHTSNFKQPEESESLLFILLLLNEPSLAHQLRLLIRCRVMYDETLL